MKTTRYLGEEELIRRGLQALIEALGPVETTRFLNLKRSRRLESVTRHRRWQSKLNEEAFFDKVFNP